MKTVIILAVVFGAVSLVASEKVDAIWKFIEENEKVEASTPKGDDVMTRFEAMQNALSPEEKKELESRLMVKAMERMKVAAKRFVEVPVDTPAAKVDYFADETNSVDSVFGVPFGTKVDKEIVTPGSDAGPMGLLMNDTDMKIPQPVKWFTTVSGQPDMRNKRIYSLRFRAEIPDSMSEAELQRGIRQLEQLMAAKFGKDCFQDRSASRDFMVKISDSKKEREELEAKYPAAKNDTASSLFKVPRTLTLYVENHRIAKLDPEIPEPKDGDGFADDLKIPEGLELAEPESESESILPKSKKCIPPQKVDFRLINGTQGGIYRYQATVNPGEEGEVYLRAYEVTKGTRLSADRMKQRTREKVTGKGEQVVGIGKEFTIYEGDWGKFYAARLEIWFIPANGGVPRKLKEKLFRVQGWMF